MLKKLMVATLMSLILINAGAENMTVPSGSFVGGELAQTLNVSVSKGASTAVLIHLNGKVSSSGNQKITLSHCDLYGQAVADQESGRIDILPEIMACKNSEGQFQYVHVKGAIYDKGGKSGIAAQFLTMLTQEIATVDSGTALDVFFFDSFKLSQ